MKQYIHASMPPALARRVELSNELPPVGDPMDYRSFKADMEVLDFIELSNLLGAVGFWVEDL